VIFHGLLVYHDVCFRYYEKSIIKEEIEEQRNIVNNHWDETKQSIKEARYRIGQEMEQFARKHKKPSLIATNGTSP
jgi:hypothetical protein